MSVAIATKGMLWNVDEIIKEIATDIDVDVVDPDIDVDVVDPVKINVTVETVSFKVDDDD